MEPIDKDKPMGLFEIDAIYKRSRYERGDWFEIVFRHKPRCVILVSEYAAFSKQLKEGLEAARVCHLKVGDKIWVDMTKMNDYKDEI